MVRYSRDEARVPGSSPIPYLIFFLLSFFAPFFVLLFSINIYLNTCYLIKCNTCCARLHGALDTLVNASKKNRQEIPFTKTLLKTE